MAQRAFAPITPGRRFYTTHDFTGLTKKRPLKSLLSKRMSSGGRNNQGHETNINRGGGHKRRYRLIDFKREKDGILAQVVSIEYDPNRSARIALLHYLDGEKHYILAPRGLQVGQRVVSGSGVPIQVGNALPLAEIPTGVSVHNVELKQNGGAKIARSAGNSVQVVAKEGDYAQLKLPSGEVRKVSLSCKATVGELGNEDHQNIMIGKAGRSRWLNRRPHNRGVSKNPVDHPLGGGEGKSKGGRHPCSPTGVLAKGLKTRNNKRTDKFIVRRRGVKG